MSIKSGLGGWLSEMLWMTLTMCLLGPLSILLPKPGKRHGWR